jgi:hypothetical protein
MLFRRFEAEETVKMVPASILRNDRDARFVDRCRRDRLTGEAFERRLRVEELGGVQAVGFDLKQVEQIVNSVFHRYFQ